MSNHLNKGNRVIGSALSRPLRVALVTSSLGLAAAEKQTVYIAPALLHAGIEIRVFYLGGGGYYETVLRQMRMPLSQIYAPNRPWVILARLIGAFCLLRPHLVLVNQFGEWSGTRLTCP